MRQLRLAFLLTAGCILWAGCSSSAPSATPTGPPNTSIDQTQADTPIEQPTAPDPSLQDPSSTTPEQLKVYKNSYDSAKAAHAKKPNVKSLTQAYADATVKYATGMMMADSLEPHTKYPGALRLYREALKVDPSNTEAKNNKDLIEGIYKNSLHRPIPN